MFGLGHYRFGAMRFPSACLFSFCLSFSATAAAQGSPTAPPAQPGPGAGGPAPRAQQGSPSPAPAPRPQQGGPAAAPVAPRAAPAAGSPAAGSPAAGSPAAGAASTAAAGPTMPEVNDTMLAPVEMPPQILSNWQQALELVRSRSTSVASARAR